MLSKTTGSNPNVLSDGKRAPNTKNVAALSKRAQPAAHIRSKSFKQTPTHLKRNWIEPGGGKQLHLHPDSMLLFKSAKKADVNVKSAPAALKKSPPLAAGVRRTTDLDDPCDPNPCLAGGTCVKHGAENKCLCRSGFTGNY